MTVGIVAQIVDNPVDHPDNPADIAWRNRTMRHADRL
jgi:hypothetical protein